MTDLELQEKLERIEGLINEVRSIYGLEESPVRLEASKAQELDRETLERLQSYLDEGAKVLKSALEASAGAEAKAEDKVEGQGQGKGDGTASQEQGQEEKAVSETDVKKVLALLKRALILLGGKGYYYYYSSPKKEDQAQAQAQALDQDQDQEILQLLEGLGLNPDEVKAEEKSAWTDCIKKQMKQGLSMVEAAKVCKRELGLGKGKEAAGTALEGEGEGESKGKSESESKSEGGGQDPFAEIRRMIQGLEQRLEKKEEDSLKLKGLENQIMELTQALDNLNPGSRKINPDGLSEKSQFEEDPWAGAIRVQG